MAELVYAADLESAFFEFDSRWRHQTNKMFTTQDNALLAELVDAADSKSVSERSPGSSPGKGTNRIK